jgi:hypothetical protein
MLAVVAAERPEEAPMIARWREFENFRLPLRGNDLEVPGGPHIARALEEARQAVWSGQIAPDEARTYARQIAKRLFEEAQR